MKKNIDLYLFLFYSILAKCKTSSNSSTVFRLWLRLPRTHIKADLRIRNDLYTIWWKYFIPLTSFDCQSFSYVLMKHWTILTHTRRNRKNQWGNMDNIRSHVVISGKVRTSISTVACQVHATDTFESRKNIF